MVELALPADKLFSLLPVIQPAVSCRALDVSFVVVFFLEWVVRINLDREKLPVGICAMFVFAWQMAVSVNGMMLFIPPTLIQMAIAGTHW